MTVSDDQNKCVIYKLTCSENGKIYIGKTINLKHRLQRYKNFTQKTNGKYHFQNAILKYGWDSFTLEILEEFTSFDKFNEEHKNNLLKREAHYIELFDTTNREVGYNICKFSNDRTGFKCSEETREKMRNRIFTDEHRSKISKSCKGISRTKETKEKMRQSAILRGCSEEKKELLRTVNIGRECSEETREKLRQANLGKPRPQEVIDKIKQTKLRKKLLNEQHP
jgi:group I intron endonuclease